MLRLYKNNPLTFVFKVNYIGSVVEFLSYEGNFTAVNGAAEGLSSTDIGISESINATSATSLQLTGLGSKKNDFHWISDISTFGSANVDQILFVTNSPTLRPTHSPIKTCGSCTYEVILETTLETTNQNVNQTILTEAIVVVLETFSVSSEKVKTSIFIFFFGGGSELTMCFFWSVLFFFKQFDIEIDINSGEILITNVGNNLITDLLEIVQNPIFSSQVENEYNNEGNRNLNFQVTNVSSEKESKNKSSDNIAGLTQTTFWLLITVSFCFICCIIIIILCLRQKLKPNLRQTSIKQIQQSLC